MTLSAAQIVNRLSLLLSRVQCRYYFSRRIGTCRQNEDGENDDGRFELHAGGFPFNPPVSIVLPRFPPHPSLASLRRPSSTHRLTSSYRRDSPPPKYPHQWI